MQWTSRKGYLPSLFGRLAIALAAVVMLFSTPARAGGGSVKLRSNEATEVAGTWHLFVTIELPSTPSVQHVPMKFFFTKTAVFERNLVDGKTAPVVTRTAVTGQQPTLETFDVDFSDVSGKIFKGTRFDFSLERKRGYEAGEYKVQVRNSNGNEVGGTLSVTLKGDNPPVDRRTIAFNAKGSGDKSEAPASSSSPPVDKDYVPPSRDIQPAASATPFVSQDAYDKTPEEEIRERPKGCGGCAASPAFTTSGAAFTAFGLLALVLGRIRKRA